MHSLILKSTFQTRRDSRSRWGAKRNQCLCGIIKIWGIALLTRHWCQHLLSCDDFNGRLIKRRRTTGTLALGFSKDVTRDFRYCNFARWPGLRPSVKHSFALKDVSECYTNYNLHFARSLHCYTWCVLTFECETLLSKVHYIINCFKFTSNSSFGGILDKITPNHVLSKGLYLQEQ